MARIAERAESALPYREIFQKQSSAQKITVTEAISQSVASSALDLSAKAIITATESGYTARMVSKYRPMCPIVAVTPNEEVMRRLSLIWGVIPVLGDVAESTDEMFQIAVESAKQSGLVGLGDLVVITAGVPVGRSGTTNLIKIHHVGEMIAKGQGIGTQSATGKVIVAHTSQEAVEKAFDGCIIVCPMTDKDYMPAFTKAAAVITASGGITSHAAVVGLSLGKPVIVSVDRVMELLEDGMEVSVYPEVGIIYSGEAKVL